MGPRIDIRILNFALSIEHFAQAFYDSSLSQYRESDFESSGYPGWVRKRYQQIEGNKDTHVGSLYDAITAVGGTPIGSCEYRLCVQPTKKNPYRSRV